MRARSHCPLWPGGRGCSGDVVGAAAGVIRWTWQGPSGRDRHCGISIDQETSFPGQDMGLICRCSCQHEIRRHGLKAGLQLVAELGCSEITVDTHPVRVRIDGLGSDQTAEHEDETHRDQSMFLHVPFFFVFHVFFHMRTVRVRPTIAQMNAACHDGAVLGAMIPADGLAGDRPSTAPEGWPARYRRLVIVGACGEPPGIAFARSLVFRSGGWL